MRPNPLVISMLAEFGPITLFFLGYFFVEFYTAVALLVSGTLLSVAVSKWYLGRLPLFSLIVSIFIVASGCLTLLTHNPFWIAIEYAISNALFGVVLIGGALAGKGLLKPLFEGMFAITDIGWRTLSLRWGIFFILVAVGSEFMWRWYSYDVWVYYRFISMFAMFVFGTSQFFLSRRERLPEASPWGLRRERGQY
jgi:intracellular septation protein